MLGQCSKCKIVYDWVPGCGAPSGLRAAYCYCCSGKLVRATKRCRLPVININPITVFNYDNGKCVRMEQKDPKYGRDD